MLSYSLGRGCNARPHRPSVCKSLPARTCQPGRQVASVAARARQVDRALSPLGAVPTPTSTTRREQLVLLAALAGLALAPRRAAAGAEAATPASRAVEAIRRDFVEQQYYVTGLLSRELFAPDCVFKDPTVEVIGVEPYVKALQTLFDPATSRADLISLQVTGANTLALRWRLEGSLKLGGLKIKPYTGTTVYTIADNGKVVRHEETWDISTVDAFVSTFFPGFGAPPAPPVGPPSL